VNVNMSAWEIDILTIHYNEFNHSFCHHTHILHRFLDFFQFITKILQGGLTGVMRNDMALH
jgi:hypothetical protein